MNYCSSAADATTLLPVYTLTQMKCAQHLTFKSYTVHILLFIYCCTTLPVYTLTQPDEVCLAIHIKVIYTVLPHSPSFNARYKVQRRWKVQVRYVLLYMLREPRAQWEGDRSGAGVMYKRLPGAESCPKKVAPGFEAPKFSLPARSERVVPPVSLLPLSHTSSSFSLLGNLFFGQRSGQEISDLCKIK